MQDYMVRATAFEGKARLFVARTTRLVEEMRNRHDMFPTAAAAIGRTATAGLMMGAMLKGNEKITIRVRGNGPIGQIVVDANARGEVRGYADEPQTHLPSNALGKLDVAGAVGREGFIYVIKDLGLKEPYRGSTPIVSGELAEDFTYYFAKSEQTPSAVSLGVLVNRDYTIQHAGGFILQLLPGLDEAEIATLERALAAMPPVTALLERGLTPEDIVYALSSHAEILGTLEAQFQCSCSHERVENTLISLGRNELQSILSTDGKAEVVCHFCNEKYQFDRTELMALLTRMDS
jgi:molecular chaperone Hsp33